MSAGTLGSGVRARELMQVNPWWIVAGRAAWWLVVHPYVWMPMIAAFAVGWWGRSLAVTGLSLLILGVFALTVWIGVTVARGSSRSVKPILLGLRRTVQVRRLWPGIAMALGYDQPRDEPAFPSAPPLRRVRITAAGGVEAVAVTGAVVRHASKLEGAAPDIAAGMFCDRVRVRVLNASEARLTFEWGKHLTTEYRLHDLPAASQMGWPARVVFGVTEDGGPAELVANLSVLVGGASGSGKSSAAWAILAGYLKADIPIRVRVLDPGELEFAALKKQLDAGKPGICHQYVTDTDKIDGFWRELDRAFNARRAAVRGTDVREHEPTDAEPLDILVIDELLPYASKLKTEGVDHIIGKLAYLGRKFGFLVIACTQVGQVDAVGRVRDLFPQRLCFRTKNRPTTDAVLGDGAESDGARCSDIDIADRGVCYLEVPGQRGYVAARSVYVPDGELAELAAGRFPAPPTPGSVLAERRNRKPTVLYRHYDRDGTLLYIGISNHYEARVGQHTDDKPWWPLVDLERSERETYPTRDLAETAELLAIAQERPLFNYAGNDANPYRIHWLSYPAGTNWSNIVEMRVQQMIREGVWKGRRSA